MLNIKSKRITLVLFLGMLSLLITPALVQAELGGSGSTAARDAAEQKAAKERKLEKKRQKEAEAKKAAEAQTAQPAETAQPAQDQAEKPATQ